MHCIVDKLDSRGVVWKMARQPDVKLDKFEAVEPCVRGNNIGMKLVNITVVEEDEIPTFSILFNFFLELQTLHAQKNCLCLW